MSIVQPQQPPDRRLSPGLNVNLPTNNPFRRGPNSPSLNTPPERPTSKNPFLDQSFEMASADTQRAPSSPAKASRPTDAKMSETEILLKELSVGDKPARSENMPPRKPHRPTRSQEDEQRRAGKPPGRADTLDIFADPPARRPTDGRPRRNSESSIADRSSKLLEADEDKRRRERRHREHRQKDSKGRPVPSGSGKRPNKRLDVIDKLDVTSIFGTGVFHHDGPFDACNPHRNRKGSSKAPMAAFPKDSANNAMGGSGPVNKNIDLAQYHGHQPDSFGDFNAAPGRNDMGPNGDAVMGFPGPGFRGNARPGADRVSNFNTTTNVDPVHGDESLGLGTSTFLEGAPAARTAIERRESEEDTNAAAGLSRKRSLAQRIRGGGSFRPRGTGEPVASPTPRWERTTSPEGVQSAGGLPKINEKNPFFQNHDEEYDKKGASIRVAQQERSGSDYEHPARPQDTLKRTVTEGSAGLDGDGKNAGGFLSRVKSLRKNKPRPDVPARQ